MRYFEAFTDNKLFRCRILSMSIRISSVTVSIAGLAWVLVSLWQSYDIG